MFCELALEVFFLRTAKIYNVHHVNLKISQYSLQFTVLIEFQNHFTLLYCIWPLAVEIILSVNHLRSVLLYCIKTQGFFKVTFCFVFLHFLKMGLG